MFVITGGGSGIGRALAITLDARGYDVLIVGRRSTQLAEVVAKGKQIEACCTDLSTVSGRSVLVERLSRYPSLLGLVHNAGIIEPIAPLRKVNEMNWRTVMATNIEAPLWLTQALFSQLIDGRILHVGSGAAYFPVKGWAAYCVSKAALAMLTRCWQLEHPELALASVMPGIIDTDMQAIIRQANGMDQAKQNYFIALKNSNHLLSAQQVAEFLAHLLLDVSRADYVAKEWDIYTDSKHEFPHA